MLISYNTLKKLIDFPQNPEELSALLTSTGLEVEGLNEVLSVPGGLKGLVLGKVETCEQHPNADKLKCTTVDIGQDNLLNIVCGAPNVAAGQTVIVATVGTTLYPGDGESFVIKKSKIRGEVSEGMLCAEDEIGLGKGHDGILVVNTDLPVGTPAATYFKLESDYAIEIGLTPNRADAASHFGTARDIKAVTGAPINLPDVSGFVLGNASATIDLVVEDVQGCPRFCGLEIKNVEVKESPDWLKGFLTTIGVNSINNLVDISNYICHFLGQPMHIYDADKIAGNKIIVKTPEKGTTVTTLDGVVRKLSGEDLAICDIEGPIGLAGVFGGDNSGVSNGTKNVFLEVAYFHPDRVRKTATTHSLKTDASFRYERGTDPEMPGYALKLAALMVLELSGGEVANKSFDLYPVKVPNHEVDVKFKNIDRLLGKTLPQGLIKEILQKLDIKIVEENNQGMSLSVPAYRVDVTREADVVEEILRIYGFDNIALSENLSSDYLSDFREVVPETQSLKISELLAANGFYEIQTLSIVKPSQNAVLNEEEGSQVTLLNPLTEDLSEMRNSLLFSGLQTLAYNINRRSKDLKVFEFGRVYGKKETDGNVSYFDQSKLGLWVTGNKLSESWQQKSEKVTFFDLKNEVSKIFATMRLSGLGSKESESGLFDYGIDLTLNNKVVASIGQVKASHLKFADLKQEVFYAEIDWAYVLKKYSYKVTFSEISKFPDVRRDLSLVVDKAVSFTQIKDLAMKSDKKLLKEVNVFDVYEGDKLGEGKKSYSVSFILRDTEKTLQDKVIDKTMSKLIYTFENQLGAEIRR
ncbi:phenylalanine--tRNA ligase subunit beta [uncultured Arcticibacterium sp.]|uniref:phenylalanine--tRNA ligase subunit beta n=1 Tax=uncultured Arcticibacterium sp. TaxID=2173042 RepID=UPI0030F81D93